MRFRNRPRTTSITIHASATRPSQDWRAADIDRLHRSNGWAGNGYHIVIPRYTAPETHELGFRCRPMDAIGAHAGPDANNSSIGICMIGGVTEKDVKVAENNYTHLQFEHLEYTILALLERYPTIQEIKGHRDWPNVAKDCPSFDVAEWVHSRGLAPKAQRLSSAVSDQPAPPGTKIHRVTKGDTLWRIARDYSTTIAKIRELNPSVDPARLFIGQALRVPAK